MSEFQDFMKDVDSKVEGYLKAKKELEEAKRNLDSFLDSAKILSTKISGMLSEDSTESEAEPKEVKPSKPVKAKEEKPSKEEPEVVSEPEVSIEDEAIEEKPSKEKVAPKKPAKKVEPEKVVETKSEESNKSEESSVKHTKDEKIADLDDSLDVEFDNMFSDDELSGLGLDFSLDAELGDSDVDNIEL